MAWEIWETWEIWEVAGALQKSQQSLIGLVRLLLSIPVTTIRNETTTPQVGAHLTAKKLVRLIEVDFTD